MLWCHTGSASFPSLNSGVSSISTLAVGSSSVRGNGDLLNVSVTPTGNYIYLNNGGALGGYDATGTPASFPWMIEMSGLKCLDSLYIWLKCLNSTHSLYNWYINSSGICSLQNLCIGSANMRTSTDRLNVSLSNTGSYLFF